MFIVRVVGASWTLTTRITRQLGLHLLNGGWLAIWNFYSTSLHLSAVWKKLYNVFQRPRSLACNKLPQPLPRLFKPIITIKQTLVLISVANSKPTSVHYKDILPRQCRIRYMAAEVRIYSPPPFDRRNPTCLVIPVDSRSFLYCDFAARRSV